MAKHSIVVEVDNIKVCDSYYEFEYSVRVDGDVEAADLYQNDHCWRDDIGGFKKMLEDGYAMKIALMEFAE